MATAVTKVTKVTRRHKKSRCSFIVSVYTKLDGKIERDVCEQESRWEVMNEDERGWVRGEKEEEAEEKQERFIWGSGRECTRSASRYRKLPTVPGLGRRSRYHGALTG